MLDLTKLKKGDKVKVNSFLYTEPAYEVDYEGRMRSTLGQIHTVYYFDIDENYVVLTHPDWCRQFTYHPNDLSILPFGLNFYIVNSAGNFVDELLP